MRYNVKHFINFKNNNSLIKPARRLQYNMYDSIDASIYEDKKNNKTKLLDVDVHT